MRLEALVTALSLLTAISVQGRGNRGVAHPAHANTHTANAHALAEERSDDSQQRVVGSSELKGGEA